MILIQSTTPSLLVDRDIYLLLVGAGIALATAIITGLLQHFLSLRADRIKFQREEEAEKLKWEREQEVETLKRERETEEKNSLAVRKTIMAPLSKEQVKICPSCGATLRAAAKFCPRCGLPVGKDT